MREGTAGARGQKQNMGDVDLIGLFDRDMLTDSGCPGKLRSFTDAKSGSDAQCTEPDDQSVEDRDPHKRTLPPRNRCQYLRRNAQDRRAPPN